MKSFILSRLFPYFLISLFPVASSAQFSDKTFDAAFRTLKDGTGKVDSLNKLCRKMDDDGKAIACEIKVMALAEKLTLPDGSQGYRKGIAQSLNNIGVAYYQLERGSQALEYHRRALKIREELLQQAVRSANPDDIATGKKDISGSRHATDSQHRHVQAIV